MNNSSLARVQAVSGLLFSLFVLVHLANTALAIAGADVYDGFQSAARSVYQWPLLELALIGTLLTHITSGVLRMRTRRGTKAQPALRLRLHRYAGYFLAIFVFGHIGATRVPVALGVVGVSAPRVIRKGPGFWAPVSIGIGVIVAALLAFGGVLFEIADPFDNEFARAYEASAAFVSGNGS